MPLRLHKVCNESFTQIYATFKSINLDFQAVIVMCETLYYIKYALLLYSSGDLHKAATFGGPITFGIE